ncbi:sensory histidine kinase DcuS [Clostridiales bacterium CHKCI001]|nr:sensory histidine kinase DcuS [Clostridiales bacterium CHKCI001]
MRVFLSRYGIYLSKTTVYKYRKKALNLAAVIMSKKLDEYIYEKDTQTYIFFFLLFPISGFLMSGMITSLKSKFRIILIGSIFLVDIIFLPFILKLIRDAHLESTLDTLQKEVKKELDYYNTLENQLAQMRKIRHDFNNQLQTAYMLLENPNLEISSIPDYSKLLSTPQFCENKILDFILQSSYSHAKELGISLDFDVVLPDSIGVENIDLCSIFSNLLNNAIHAAQKTENPFISLKISYSNNKLIVELSNTTLEKELEYRDPKFHGYRLLILNDLAKKYNGNFSTQKKEGIFYAYFSIFVHS